MKRSVAVVAALLALVIFRVPMTHAAMWGNLYLSSDQFGRCADRRLSPDVRIDECMKAVRSKLARHTAQLVMLDLLGEAFRDKNQFNSAATALTKAIQFAESQEISYYRYRRGEMYLDAHDTGMAVADFKILLTANGEDGYGYLGLGEIAAHEGRYADAIVQFNKAAALRTNDPMILSARAEAYALSGDYQKAMSDEDTIIGMFKWYGFSYNGRCWNRALANRDLDLALADCNQSVGEQPDDPYALDSRGLVRFRQRQWDDAIADYNAALKRNPYFAPSIFMRGMAEVRKGDAEVGRADIAKAETLSPGTTRDYVRYGISP